MGKNIHPNNNNVNEYLMKLLSIPTGEINGSIDIKNRALNVAREVKELDKQLDYLIGTSTGKKI